MRAKEFVAEEINPDIRNTSFKHRQQIGEYTYTATVETSAYNKNMRLFVVRCFDGRNMIGKARFYITPESLVSSETQVDSEYRRVGIASTMYAYAKMLGNDIEPSAWQLPPGRAMWQSWTKSGDARHLLPKKD